MSQSKNLLSFYLIIYLYYNEIKRNFQIALNKNQILKRTKLSNLKTDFSSIKKIIKIIIFYQIKFKQFKLYDTLLTNIVQQILYILLDTLKNFKHNNQ